MIGLVLILCMTSFPEEPATHLNWKDLTRDIYVDGFLDKEARSYYCRNFGYAVFLPGSKDLVLVENGEETYPVSLLDASDFELSPDKLEAKTPLKFGGRVVGEAAVIDGKHLLIEASGKSILIARHEGRLGNVDESELWDIVPSWKSLMARFQPDPKIVKRLEAVDAPVHLKIYFGTWCGDSKREVPKFLKTLALADNQNITAELLMISGDFGEPWDGIRDDRITNVPTIIATSDGEELGRLVEHGQGSSMGADFVDILGASFLPKPGDDSRGEPMASGSLNHKNADGALTATEHWHLYSREHGNSIYARVLKDDVVYDIWAVTGEDTVLKYLEITETLPNQIARGRYSISGKRVSATIRGGNRGIIRQKFSFRGTLIPETPSVMINGWLAGSTMAEVNDRFILEPLVGRLEVVSGPVYGDQFLIGALGRLAVRKTEWSDRQWWHHQTYQIPVRMESGDGSSAELVYLQWVDEDQSRDATQAFD